MTDYLSTELAATCAALGYYDGHTYHLDKHCIDVIKDLIKYLRRDDDSHTVRRFLGQTKLLQTDLMKIFVEHSNKPELWDVLLRLIINLTSPVLVIYNEQVPTEKMERTIYQKLIAYTQTYKVALTHDSIWSTLSSRLSEILKIDTIERGEEMVLIIERILVFIRNVLQIPPDENEKRVDNDVTIHDQVLFALNASGLVDLLLFIASNRSEQQNHMQVLEIVSLMLRDQNASQLASSGLQRSNIEKEKDEAILLAARLKEKQEKMERIKKYTSARHSRFGGTYVVQNMKAIGENQLLCHKPYQKIESLNFSQEKGKVSKPKNKRRMSDPRSERTSTLSVRLFLKEFCVEFLNAAYNPVMKYTKSAIVGASHADPVEITFYLWSLRFFMEFNRHYKFEVKYVSETISTEIFHFVQRQMEYFYEMIVTDKKKIPVWSRRLHLALKAYQELLYTLMAMDQSTDQGVRSSSKVIKSNVFYVPEYRETILSQLLCYDEVKMSRQYLVDLTTTVHVFLKMLGHYSSKSSRNVLVQKVKKRLKSGHKKKSVQKEQPPQRSLDDRWDDIGPQLSVVMREGTIPEVVPFDATLDIPIDEQKADAMKKIQKQLRTKDLEQAIGLIRAAREVWPENDCFGRADIPPEEEFLALREIFFADLGVIEDDQVTETETNIEQLLDNEEDEDEEEESQPRSLLVETDFNFADFVHRFANVKVVKAMLILLQQFDKNTDELNHYVNKMLHRIAWDCKMPGMLFQASMFRVFQRILDSKNPAHKELQKLAVFIIRRFIEVAQKNRKAYMELLFWKTSRDATLVVDGYDAETDNKKVSRSLWTEAQEDELRTLFMEHQTNKYSQDLVDWILENINAERTRRGVIKKMKEMYLIANKQTIRIEEQERESNNWTNEEIEEIKQLWNRFKNGDDPLEQIHNQLTVKRPKTKIRDKILELGLAADRKVLYKKRSRKSNHGKSSWETQTGSNSDEDESSDEEAGKSSGHSNTAPNKPGKSKRPKKSTKKQATIVYTDAQLSGLLKDVIEKNMREALEWILESLKDILDDPDEESTEGIPLVPLTDYSSVAMDSPDFQKLLRAMGFAPPADEQESYWRIPAAMPPSMIQKRCKLFEGVLSGSIVEEVEPVATPQKEESDSDNAGSSDDGDVLENIKKYFVSKEEPSTSDGFNSDRNGSSSKGLSKRGKAPSRSAQSSKKPMEETEYLTSPAVGGSQQKKKKSGGRLKRIVDYSDSETETDTKDGGKRNRSDSTEKEYEEDTTKKRRLMDSDEEQEASTSEKRKPNRSRIITSDDDDDSEQERRTARTLSRKIISSDED